MRYGRWSGEKTHQTKSGREIVVDSRWLATCDRQGKITEILESNVDNTERKKAEDALAKKQEELQTIIDSSQGLDFLQGPRKPFRPGKQGVCRDYGVA